MAQLDLRGYGTGAKPRQYDARDWKLEKAPSVAQALAAPTPDAVDHSKWCSVVYNQGSVPACVAASICGEQSAYQSMDDNEPGLIFDWNKVYVDCGGNGKNGIYTNVALKYAVDQGLPTISPLTRRKLASYAYTTDIAVICAALAAGHLCVFAWLLPTDFWQGDCGHGQPTNNYHQTVAVGYDRPHATLKFLNSWGKGYGKQGFGTVPFSYLTANGNQSSMFYAYSTADVFEKQTPAPAPLPSDETLLHSSYDLLGAGRWTGSDAQTVLGLRAQLARRLKIA